MTGLVLIAGAETALTLGGPEGVVTLANEGQPETALVLSPGAGGPLQITGQNTSLALANIPGPQGDNPEFRVSGNILQYRLIGSIPWIDLVDLSTFVPGTLWGLIGGTLSNQADLQAALDGKSNVGHTHVAANVTDFNVAADARVAAGIAAHEAAGDPHPQYLTSAEGNAAYSLLGHTHLLAAGATDVTISAANLNALDDGVNTALHFHDADRARANHTGTQLAGTISDFNEAAQDAVGAMLDASLTYVDGTPLLQRAALTGAITAAAGSNATALGSFTMAQLDAAVSDGNVSYAGHTHLLAAGATDVTISAANLNALDDGVNTALHFHDSDRARANHTGTQLSGTISDFTEAAQDAVGAMLDATLTYVDGTPLLQRAAISGHISIPAGSNAAVLGAFTMAELDGAVSDGNVSYVGHSHSGLAPAGGSAGEVLKKVSGDDYDYDWLPDSGGGGGSPGGSTGDIQWNNLGSFDGFTMSGDVTVVTSTGVATIANDAVTFAKMQNIATSRFLGRVTAASGNPEELTGTQATALLDNFTSTLKGLAPLSGGGTTNFLRADGTWAAPAGIAAASQAEQEAGSSTTVATTPGRQHFHPSAVKCWGMTTGGASQTLSASYNITSITDNANGQLTFTIANDFSSADWASLLSGSGGTTAGTAAMQWCAGKAAGSIDIRNADFAPTLEDPSVGFNFAGLGDL